MIVLFAVKSHPEGHLYIRGNMCTLWRQYTHSVWSVVEETRLLVSHEWKGSVFIILQKCTNLKHLTLDVRSEIDDTLLRTIANLTPCLASLEIQISQGGINEVTGDVLNYFTSTSNSILENCKKRKPCLPFKQRFHRSLPTMSETFIASVFEGKSSSVIGKVTQSWWLI